MALFKTIAKFFNLLYVEERNNTIYVMNVDGMFIQSVVRKIWPHTRLASQMFTQIGKSFFSFNSFFAPDIVFMITKMMSQEETTWKQRMVYRRIIDQIYANTWLQRTRKEYPPLIDLKKISLFKLTPYPKQKEFLETYSKTLPMWDVRGMILAGQPGTGKTMIGLMTAESLIPSDLTEVVIIIAPKPALHLVWEKSFKTLYKKPPTAWFSDTGVPLVQGYRYYVFNFDALDKAVALGRLLVKNKIKFFTIVDESHNLNEIVSLQTKRAIELCTLCPESYFLWMSGSPIKAMGRELIPFLKCSDLVHFDADAEARFHKIYGMGAGLATEIFYHRFGLMTAFKIDRKDVVKMDPIIVPLLVTLPKAQSDRFLIENIRKDMKLYMKTKVAEYQDQITEHQDRVRTALAYYETTLQTGTDKSEFQIYLDRFEKIQYNDESITPAIRTWCRSYEQSKIIPSLKIEDRVPFAQSISVLKSIKHKVLGEVLGNVVGKRREECADALAVSCNAKKIIDEALGKVMFYASNVSPLEKLEKQLIAQGYHPLMATGKTASTFNTKMEEFATNPLINPILATFQFLKEAVPVTEANTIVMINRPFRQYIWEQVIARALRLGQKRQVYIIEVTLDTGTELNISTRTDVILSSVRDELRGLIGPEFAGPVSKQQISAVKEIVETTSLPEEKPYPKNDVDSYPILHT